MSSEKNPLLSQPYAVVLLDFDGTLVNSHSAIYKSLVHSLEQTDLSEYTDLAGTLVYRLLSKGEAMGDAGKDMLEDIQVDTAYTFDDLFTIYKDHYHSTANINAFLYKGIPDALKTLATHNVKLGVVTNKERPLAEGGLAHFGLLDYFDIIIADEPGNIPKPDPHSYNAIIKKQLGLADDARVLMIGDTPTDITYAHNCGIDSCWVNYGFGEDDDISGCNPTYIVDSIQDWVNLALGKK